MFIIGGRQNPFLLLTAPLLSCYDKLYRIFNLVEIGILSMRDATSTIIPFHNWNHVFLFIYLFILLSFSISFVIPLMFVKISTFM